MMTRLCARGPLCVLLCCLAAPYSQAAAPCAGAEFRQFDFWLGDWLVFTADGKLAGSNQITREYQDCVIHERYQTPTGYQGESLNTYDKARQRWHQTWVDNSGTLLLLDGQWQAGAMVLTGTVPASKDSPAVQHRISWTPLPDGQVRQHWQSTDAKGQWITAFDGYYRKVKQP